MQYKRADRVGDQILREVSQLLLEEVKDPRIGMVTISRVQVTNDLSYARVYYTVFGDEAQRANTAEGLKKATGFIRKQIGRRMRLRITPEIIFKFDESLDHAERINQLLSGLQKERTEWTSAAEGAEAPSTEVEGGVGAVEDGSKSDNEVESP